jgi:hypothetical protein
MALSDDYIADAKSTTAGATTSRQSLLRRGTSTAYYALFLELVDAASVALAPSSPAGLSKLVGRRLAHESMKKACAQWNSGGNPWGSAMTVGATPQDLKEVAAAFVDLQQLRHEADYDLGATLSSVAVQANIVRAEQAISKWRAFRLTAPDTANVFLVSLMHSTPR